MRGAPKTARVLDGMAAPLADEVNAFSEEDVDTIVRELARRRGARAPGGRREGGVMRAL